MQWSHLVVSSSFDDANSSPLRVAGLEDFFPVISEEGLLGEMNRFWELIGIGHFDRAHRSAEHALDRAKPGTENESDGMELFRGLLLALLLVTPFWLLVAFVIHLLR